MSGTTGWETERRLKAAERLADMGHPDGFEILLDTLENEPDPWQRGSDMPLNEVPRIADRVIALVGHPDTYDAMGTQTQRDTVTARWRRRFRTEGYEFLKGLHPHRSTEGRQDADLGELHLSRDMSDMRTGGCLTSGSGQIHACQVANGG